MQSQNGAYCIGWFSVDYIIFAIFGAFTSQNFVIGFGGRAQFMKFKFTKFKIMNLYCSPQKKPPYDTTF